MRPRIALLCEWGEQMGANAKPSQFSSSSQAAQSLSKATTNGRLSRITLRRICCCLASICGLDQISLIYLWVWSDQSVCLRAIRSDLSDLPPFLMRLGSLSSAAMFWRQKKSTLPLRSLAISDSNWGQIRLITNKNPLSQCHKRPHLPLGILLKTPNSWHKT